MSKALFYPMFKKAWDISFTKENIIHAFDKPGIWPIDAEKVLKVIRKPQKQPSLVPEYLRTPANSRSIMNRILYCSIDVISSHLKRVKLSSK